MGQEEEVENILKDNHKWMTIKELAGLCGLSAGGVNASVNKLIRQGTIERKVLHKAPLEYKYRFNRPNRRTFRCKTCGFRRQVFSEPNSVCRCGSDTWIDVSTKQVVAVKDMPADTTPKEEILSTQLSCAFTSAGQDMAKLSESVEFLILSLQNEDGVDKDVKDESIANYTALKEELEELNKSIEVYIDIKDRIDKLVSDGCFAKDRTEKLLSEFKGKRF